MLDGPSKTDADRARLHASRVFSAAVPLVGALILTAVDALRWTFRIPQGKRSAWNIVLWWEIRRIPYNIIICGLLVGGLAFWLAVVFAFYPDTDEGDPQLWIVMPFVFNFFYTAGWIVELCARPLLSVHWRRSLAPVLFAVGFLLSVLVAFVPAAAAVSLVIEAVVDWFL